MTLDESSSSMKEPYNKVIDLCAPSEEISISSGSFPDDIQIVAPHRNTKYSVIDAIHKVIASNSFPSMYT